MMMVCGKCKHVKKEGNNIILKPSRFTFNIKQLMSCTVGNVIYCITCQGCREQYTGETSNLRVPVRLHKNQVRSPIYRTTGVSEHFASCARKKIPCLRSCLFIKLKQRIESFGKKPDYFIEKYKPKFNQCITVRPLRKHSLDRIGPSRAKL